MPHVEPDRLMLLALGELDADAVESDHVDRCAACQGDLDAMRVVVGHGRQTQQLSDLPTPPERLWRRIAAATIAPPASPREGLRSSGHGPRFPRMPRWVRDAAIAVTSAAVAVLGTLALLGAADPSPAPPVERVAAAAQLATLPGAPSGAQGVARVLDDGAGERLHLHVTGLPLRPGFYEVWLINPETFEMVSVGTLRDGGDDRLPLPSTIDLRKYRLVDVSAEEYDGNVEHSGRSMLRGSLAA